MNHNQQPFRVKRRMVCVRLSPYFSSCVFPWQLRLSISKSKFSILNRPQSRARKFCCCVRGETAVLANETTSAEGTATFHTQTTGSYQSPGTRAGVCRRERRRSIRHFIARSAHGESAAGDRFGNSRSQRDAHTCAGRSGGCGRGQSQRRATRRPCSPSPPTMLCVFFLARS